MIYAIVKATIKKKTEKAILIEKRQKSKWIPLSEIKPLNDEQREKYIVADCIDLEAWDESRGPCNIAIKIPGWLASKAGLL